MKMPWRSLVRLLAVILAMSGLLAGASAHEVRPAYLDVHEETPGVFTVLLKTPMQGNARLALSAAFSGRVEKLTPVVSRPTGNAMLQTWQIRAVEPLEGQSVSIDGLQSTMTDALVRVEFLDGYVWLERLTPGAPGATIPATQSSWTVAKTYILSGIEHILFGFDHLLFVASLMLIVRDWRMLVKTVTAFTVAHSITLTFATLGWATLPSAPVEVMIAFSIVLVGAEIVRMERGKTSLTITWPWVVAFVFGLLHGFGFAGALVDLGLPRSDIPLALFSFNIGVEFGQLMFIAAILAILHSVRRFMAIPRHAVVASAYGIGTIAAFWGVERARRPVAGGGMKRCSGTEINARIVNMLREMGGINMRPTSFKSTLLRNSALALLLIAAGSLQALAQETVHTDIGDLDAAAVGKLFPEKPPYSPYAGRNFPTRPLFGDTHLHTSFSMDAGAFGARLGPADAYRFAKGQEVMASSGQPAKLSRPLDFLVVADHSDNMGFFPDLMSGKAELLADPLGRKWYDMIQNGQGPAAALDIITSFGAGKFKGPILYSPDSDAYKSAWRETIKAADEANDPGRFTAFIGYEWTVNTGGNNLHRNIIFRDNGEKASQVVPYTVLPPGSDNPRDLWKWMAAYEAKTGGDVLAHCPQRQLVQWHHVPDDRTWDQQADRP